MACKICGGYHVSDLRGRECAEQFQKDCDDMGVPVQDAPLGQTDDERHARADREALGDAYCYSCMSFHPRTAACPAFDRQEERARADGARQSENLAKLANPILPDLKRNNRIEALRAASRIVAGGMSCGITTITIAKEYEKYLEGERC